TVIVEATEAHSIEEWRLKSASDLAGRIKDVVGVSTKVTVVDPGAAPRSQGKAVRVVDRRPKG
ncbi:MAG: phenylacetate--CoA ligase, partial [Pseudomonadota bacterium]